MFRLGRLTDYGIVLLAHLAREDDRARAASEAPSAQNARELAARVELPVPVVSKILKMLVRAGLLESRRGSKGGYALAHRPEEISVGEMIAALEGPLALTQCAVDPGACEHGSNCAVSSPWQVINQVVEYALAGVTLADLINPEFTAQMAPLVRMTADGEASRRPLSPPPIEVRS